MPVYLPRHRTCSSRTGVRAARTRSPSRIDRAAAELAALVDARTASATAPEAPVVPFAEQLAALGAYR